MDIRRVEFRLPDGGIMVLRSGQKLKAGENDFMISHFKRIVEPWGYTMQVYVRPIDRRITAVWKEIVNGSLVVEYSVKFLCE